MWAVGWRWEEAAQAAEHGTPVFVESLPEALARSATGFDVVIVSTGAGSRLQIVSSISKLVPVRYRIFEKLFDPVNELAGRFSGIGARAIPATLFLDVEGRVAARMLGLSSECA